MATKKTISSKPGKAKDVAAGAVLIAAIGSVIIVSLVLGPHLMTLIKSWR
jgi:diacylglycerol kinase